MIKARFGVLCWTIRWGGLDTEAGKFEKFELAIWEVHLKILKICEYKSTKYMWYNFIEQEIILENRLFKKKKLLMKRSWK